MRRKNLNVKQKVKFKNSTTKKIYNQFRKILFDNIGENNFTIGVSGGPDSLSLAYLSQIYASEFNNKVNTLIVDHKIRQKSSKEALQVHSMLKKKGM